MFKVIIDLCSSAVFGVVIGFLLIRDMKIGVT